MVPFAEAALSEALKPLQSLHVEDLLVPVFVQLILIIAVARAAGLVARRLRQPAVVGEVVAGLMLGPSLFGALFPEAFAAVFYPSLPDVDPALTKATLQKVFEVLKELGLVFLLFLIGLEFEFAHLKSKGWAALTIAVVGTAVPFALGVGLGPLIHPYLEPHDRTGVAVPLLSMTLFLGTALAITALPVLGRMMLEMGISRTRIAAVVVTAAAIGDAVGWILLATVGAVEDARRKSGEFDIRLTVRMAGLTLAFVAAMFFVVRPLAGRYFERSLDAGGQLSLNALAVLLVLLLTCAIATGLIGIFAIFGAFVLGAVLSGRHRLRDAVNGRLRDFVTAFFLPIFFTYTGLRTEVGSLRSAELWAVCAAVLAVSVAGKVLAAGAAARATGFGWREAGIVGAMMNTRGLMELIVINVGYNLGVIPKSLFCMLVLMAVVTTVTTAPLLLLLRRGTELEAPMRAGGFAK